MYFAHTVFPDVEKFLDENYASTNENPNEDYACGYQQGLYMGALSATRVILDTLYGNGYEIVEENGKHRILPNDMKES